MNNLMNDSLGVSLCDSLHELFIAICHHNRHRNPTSAFTNRL